MAGFFDAVRRRFITRWIYEWATGKIQKNKRAKPHREVSVLGREPNRGFEAFLLVVRMKGLPWRRAIVIWLGWRGN